MPIYDRPTRALMHDFAASQLSKGQTFTRDEAVAWFAQHYPKIKAVTVRMHVEGMSVNSNQRKHHSGIRPGRGMDLFFKVDGKRFRLWEPETDPQPIYPGEIPDANTQDESGPEVEHEGARTFAFERDLRNYLQRNLGLVEPGLRIYEEEEILGVEFPADGRYIDLLTVDRNENFVVIELKVSRGYDRVVGQILRYMAWVKANMAGEREVRGVIVASEISEDLKLAASLIPNLRLVEYELSFSLKPVL